MVFKGKLFFWIALHYKHTSNTLHRQQITELSRFGGGVCHLLIVWHPPIPKVRNDESITYIIARSRGWRGTVKIWCLWGKNWIYYLQTNVIGVLQTSEFCCRTVCLNRVWKFDVVSIPVELSERRQPKLVYRYLLWQTGARAVLEETFIYFEWILFSLHVLLNVFTKTLWLWCDGETCIFYKCLMSYYYWLLGQSVSRSSWI